MTRYSKLLSYVLRHRPDEVGVELDGAGWAVVDELLLGLAARDETWSREVLEEVVSTNSKRRFEFSDDGTRIRARQGHSVDVDLGYETVRPPDVLFHGTVGKFLDTILEEGLRPMARHHVHLSGDVPTAMEVGRRRGPPVVLRVDAARMVADGVEFMRTDNEVWLVEHVAPTYLTVLEEE